MTLPSPARQKTPYDGLATQGALTLLELDLCVLESKNTGQSIEHVLSAHYELKPEQLGACLSAYFGAPYLAFNPTLAHSEVLHGQLKREFVEAQGWIPLDESPSGLRVLCLDPEAVRGLRMVPQAFARIQKFNYAVTTQCEFQQTLDQLYGVEALGGTIDKLLADLDGIKNHERDETQLASAAADNELVKFVNKVIADAYYQKASDIHIEPMPGKQKTGIRLRIDGTLQSFIEVPAQFRQAMVTRLKIMCDLDIAERRKPQDGKIQFKKYGALDIELRVATIPSAGGVEDVVLRILPSGEPIALDKLGLSALTMARTVKTIEKPYGLFYVCGPTGSGKTTTLHSILKHLNTPDRKIWTVEDPVEITQKGLRQVQINRKASIDFALIMRAFLRADPDIIMVGESRDKETVALGVEASLTGHLVFSTLHTNSAPESVTRLLDMGMDPFNFADALLGILAQRLAKKLCDCKVAYTPDAAELARFVAEYSDELRNTPAWKQDAPGETDRLLAHWLQAYGEAGKLRFFQRTGCTQCHHTGYKGRMGLHELLVATEEIKQLIQQRARVADIFSAAIAGGMLTLKMDGMEKVLLGLTDLQTVRMVCIK
jgi:type II secretory ATPase GspE/PulE/Tfp pilus assembly ATPase PilB-like protein